MTDPTDDDDVDDRSRAPAIVYKYLVPDRIDVLANARIRFTPPLNTNDIFEVRQTFDLLAGPKMQALFEETAAQIDFNEAVSGALGDMGLKGIPPDTVKTLYQQLVGGDMETTMRTALSEVVSSQLFPMMNAPNAIDGLLQRTAGDLICLSLAERSDSPPMWAHYAANSAGFVLAFDTNSSLFLLGDDRRQGLRKITYFDGRLGEFMDDPYAALISKLADWAYEREWRLYVKASMADQVVAVGENEVHLVQFPRTAVKKVILGIRTSKEVEEQIRAILDENYQDVPLVRMKPDRSAASLIEVPV